MERRQGGLPGAPRSPTTPHKPANANANRVDVQSRHQNHTGTILNIAAEHGAVYIVLGSIRLKPLKSELFIFILACIDIYF